jgi:hypothetical protein
MKRIPLLTLGVLLLAITSSAQNSYYPSRVGLKWTYSSGETQEYAREDTVFGAKVLVLTRSMNGKFVSEDYVQSGADGVVLLGTRQGQQIFRYQPPVVVYPKAPLRVGSTWSTTSGTGAAQFTIQYNVTGTAGVKVKAGRFNAFIVNSQVTTAQGSTSNNDLYFVPSIGTVKYVYQDGSTIELVGR